MKWIKCSEKMPEKKDYSYDVLLYQVDTILAPPLCFIALWDGEVFLDQRFDEVQMDVITHWAYIQFPEEDK